MEVRRKLPYICLFALLCLLVVAQGSTINLPSDVLYSSMRGLLDDTMGLQPQAANLAYPAYSSYGYGPKPAPGPSKCSGVITAIWCKESADGVLTDIAYLNSETGLQLPGCSASDWTNEFTKALYLAEGESIIKVSTCKGKAPKRMFEAVTFITDAGQKLVCGKGDSSADDYSGYGHGDYGHNYPTEPYAAGQPSADPVESTLKSIQSSLQGPVKASLNSIQATLKGDDRSPDRALEKAGGPDKKGKHAPEGEDQPEDDDDDQAQDDSEPQEDDNKSSSFIPDQDKARQAEEYDPERSGKNHRSKKSRGYNKARQLSRRRNSQNKRASKYSEDSRGDDSSGYQVDKYMRKERPDASTNYQEDSSSREYVPYTRRAAKAALKQARKDARRYSTSYKGSEEGSYGYRGNGRQLRQTVEQEEAELAGADRYRGYKSYNPNSYYPHYPHHSHGPIDPAKRRYYGQPRCSIEQSPEKPIWSSVPDWYLMTAGPDSLLGFEGSGLDAYYVYADKHYFKNRNAYVKDLELIESQPSSLNYMPAYYYDEVDPLAEFKVDCSHGEKCVSSVHHFCWNNHYNSTKPDGVPGIVTIGLNPSISCPKTPAELQQFTHDLEIISDKLKEASGGIIDSIAWERYTPILCTQDFGQNATVTLQGIFVPGEGHTQTEVREWLASNAVTNEGEPDLCEVLIDGISICTDTQFYTLPYALGSVSGRRSLLGMGLTSSLTLPTGGSTFPRAGQIMSPDAEYNARRGAFDTRSGGAAGAWFNGAF